MLADLINPERIRRAVIYALILLSAHMLQGLVLSHATVFGVRPMFLPAVAVAIGVFEGGTWGGMFGLLSGLMLDTAFAETTVLFTVLFPIIGYCSGMLAYFFVNRKFFSYVCVSFAALLITAAAQAVRPVVFLDASAADAAFVAVMQALLSLPFAAAVYFPVKSLAGKKPE